MPADDPRIDAAPTRALRERSPELLRSGLLALLVDHEEVWLRDWRDLLVALAPYHDCARRLGLEPSAVFEEAAGAGPASLAGIVREFGERTDVTPTAFGFVVEDDAEGPRYRW